MRNKGKLILTGLLIAGLFCVVYYVKNNRVNRIYDDFKSFKRAQLRLTEKNEPICLVAVGDIMLSRYVAQKINEHNDPGFPFQYTEWILQSSDITFGNLENPITPGRHIKIQEMILRADPVMASALKKAGFDILSLANNHLPDFGANGVRDTILYLKNAGIDYIGAGKNEKEAYEPRYADINGYKLAFLAFSDSNIAPENYNAGSEPGTAAMNSDNMKTSIINAAKNADFVIAYLHLGTEYAPEPDEKQVYYSHLAIDAGADLVIGSHPHVVQKAELYKGKYILYSLGNFIFDQLWSEETRESVAVNIYIGKKGVERIEFTPLYINDETQPIILGGQAGQKIIDRLGLSLDPETVPMWDSGRKAFKEGKKHVLTVGKTPRKCRLIKNLQYDLDENGITENYTLKDGCLVVRVGTKIIWKSPENWWIDDFFIGDATNNGKPELCLSVWKEGSYGPYKPFWVDKDDTSVKNHLFIYRIEDSTLKPIWQSSNLDYPIINASLMDIDGDGENELVVKEGSYTDPNQQEISLWKWDEWGFKRIW